MFEKLNVHVHCCSLLILGLFALDSIIPPLSQYCLLRLLYTYRAAIAT